MIKACWLDCAELLLQTELHLTGRAGQGGYTLLNGGERKLKISMKITSLYNYWLLLWHHPADIPHLMPLNSLDWVWLISSDIYVSFLLAESQPPKVCQKLWAYHALCQNVYFTASSPYTKSMSLWSIVGTRVIVIFGLVLVGFDNVGWN